MTKKAFSKENIVLAVTAARLAQGVTLYKKAHDKKSIKRQIFGIAAADLLDGVVARRFGVDDSKRRTLDGIADVVVTGMALAAAYKQVPEARPYIGLLALRGLVVTAGSAWDYLSTEQVKKGDNYFKASSATIAAFGLACLKDNQTGINVTGIAAVSTNYALAVDHFDAWMGNQQGKMLESDVQEIAGFNRLRSLGAHKV